MTTILIVDDHPLFREGVVAALSAAPLHARVLCAASGTEALRQLDGETDIDLVLVDRYLNGEDGIAWLTRIARAYPAVARIMISGADVTDTATLANRAGAQGFIPKSHGMRDIQRAVTEVLAGRTYWPAHAGWDSRLRTESPRATQSDSGDCRVALTERQIEVLRLLAEGLSNAEIAQRLGITERTVKAHMSALFGVLGVATRAKVLVAAAAIGLLPNRRG